MPTPEQRLARLESIFSTIVELNKSFVKAKSLDDYMERVHALLAKLLFAKNFYLASYNANDNTIQYLYNVDEKDETIPADRKFALASPEQSPTAWVIANKKVLLLDSEEELDYKGDADYWGHGTRSEHWLGVPLIALSEACLGAIVVQSYDPNIGYSEEDQSLFKIIASVVASALEKHRKDKELRHALSGVHSTLSKELAEKERAEKLQHALYKIASLASQAPELDEFYLRVHKIINKLIYAKNFYIALLDEEKEELELAYFVDEYDKDIIAGTVLPIGQGLSSYVIKTREAQILSPKYVKELIEKGLVGELKGAQNYTCWLGVPMISSNILHGVLVVQSYDEKILFSKEDGELLNYVANHVAKAIEATVIVQERKEAQLKLAKQHRILAEQHRELGETVEELRRTQQQLVQQEKMASLGGLVAGIAHEINTPLGICVTGVSHLQEETKLINNALKDETLTAEALSSYIEEVNEASKILDANVQRAADLVRSFKQVAVDQSSNSVREINLHHYLDEILLSLRPTLKRVKHQLKIDCDNELTAVANAGALSQIISNLIMNSIKHGFENIEQGNIAIFVEQKGEHTILRYADDGHGIDADAMSQLFEPFYTTKRGEGGSGLGTHLVYNLVTSALNGRIEAKSEPGKGLAYLIKFPTNCK
ncbi:GAF domain-containing protein [Thalassotalea sp. M1531]|uniref:histidine kinase n=1 Tax=Thalassotalea algicola TaxID=2716224 RepID=A0A7Y0LAB8_9GAMM|nr:GAF domain-containing sensor histidine kinase [Thalassotalea algicola]NMP30870.1 GAF domain-containing protein [Thalassotalea algicola]